MDQSSNVSVSLYVCGAETLVQVASGESGFDAPTGSDLMNFQPGLKLSVGRSAPGARERRKNNSAARSRSLAERMCGRAFLRITTTRSWPIVARRGGCRH